MPVSQKKCVGLSLLNHLKQKNITVDVQYTFNNERSEWSGTMTVYGTTYLVKGKHNKQSVLRQLMEDANSFIWCNLDAKR